jgi:tetratricopeptide (TPR) repeat protein
LQDRITESVVAAIEPTLHFAEIERLKHTPPNKLDAYDLLLRAYRLEYEFTVESMTAALDCLDQALAIDPTYAPAMAAAAYCQAQRHFQGWVPRDHTDRGNGVKLAWRAVELAPNDAQVLWMAAFAIWTMEQEGREAARALFSHSLTINPNSAMALALGGWIETMRGNSGIGREMIERARRLSPLDPRGWFMLGAMALAAIIDENYAEAVTWAEKALVQNRRFAVALRVLAVALVKVGQRDRAAQVVREMLTIEPELTISGFLTRIQVPLDSMARTYTEALRAAGLPE